MRRTNLNVNKSRKVNPPTLAAVAAFLAVCFSVSMAQQPAAGKLLGSGRFDQCSTARLLDSNVGPRTLSPQRAPHSPTPSFAEFWDVRFSLPIFLKPCWTGICLRT